MSRGRTSYVTYAIITDFDSIPIKHFMELDCFRGKCLSTSRKKCRAIFELTFLLKDGLNYCAPPISAKKAFEEGLAHLIESVSFRKVNDPFLNTLKKHIQKVNSSENVFIFADKTRNLYEASPSTYNKLLAENITKSYKAGTS